MLTIQLMQVEDLAAVQTVQQHAYPQALWEETTIFAHKRQLSPETSLVAKDGLQVVAYVLSHPWLWADIPILNRINPPITANTNTLYIHDLAVDPAYQGLGLAQQLTHYLLAYAQQQAYAALALVAVQGALRYWQRYGFVVDNLLNQQLKAACLAYGEDTVYMYKKI
ncbi:GNAT family N-acetyltransferase [Agitococcus lubricus]|uniref:Putative N-acetyltransferase YhbS n=1 Tax=Agitococcus lubricus TaxID=1077255 RepID=A0A2T5J1B9_9GAMM|nr:GNAT family N-acetyltransferase [Agitococcus lubricus]PTQ90181.1 putative N-acetyltransferase YhbS [Agitococcus lubricus]